MNTVEATQALAIFWGIYLLGGYVPVLINRKLYSIMMTEKQEYGFIILAASIQIVIGAGSLALVHQWEWSLAGVVTLLGWLAVIKGVGRYLVLGFVVKVAKRMNLVFAYSYLSMHIILGFYLVYCGFWG